MKTELFAKNLKKEIKKQGYKLTGFAPDYLDMTIATFTNKCHKGTFTVNDILIIEAVLGIKFADLINSNTVISKPITIVKKDIKPINIPVDKPKAVEVINKTTAKVKSKLDILRGM